MTPSEKERIIEEGFDAIRKVYNLRDDLLSDAEKLKAARESNHKLSDRVANLEVTIRTLNSAIDKKDAEIHRLNNRLKSRDDATLTTIEAFAKNRGNIYDKYLELCHVHDADEEIKKHMIADNRKKKDEIKSLKKEYELLRKAHMKLCSDYNTLNENNAKLEDNFHELRKRLNKLYLYHIHDVLQTRDMLGFFNWFAETFGDFGKSDEE